MSSKVENYILGTDEEILGKLARTEALEFHEDMIYRVGDEE